MDKSEQSASEDGARVVPAAPGDVLIASSAFPWPDQILQGFTDATRRFRDKPFVDLTSLQAFLEFLELVVLTERIIVPSPQFALRTKKLMTDERTAYEFVRWRKPGDLALSSDALFETLGLAGVLLEAQIGVGEETVDDLVSSLLPSSAALRGQHSAILSTLGGYPADERAALADALTAAHIGAPLHVAVAAGIAHTPFVLGAGDRHLLEGVERENAHVHRSASRVLLDRLSAGARKEIEALADLGVLATCPATPIAALILQEATSPAGMIEVALQMRARYAELRRYLSQLEQDLLNEGLSIATRLKRVRELDRLAASLWPTELGELRTSAVGVAETASALIDLSSIHPAASLSRIAVQLAKLPIETLRGFLCRRRVRLLVKAKRSFLRSKNATSHIAAVLDVPRALVEESRVLQARAGA